MKTRSLALVAIVMTSLGAAAPPSAGARVDDPGIVDPVGDANLVDGAAPGVTPSTGPVSIPWADITNVWFTTEHEVEPAVRDGVRGLEKVPYALSAHIRTAAPIAPVGPGVAYAVEWQVNNSTYRLVAHVRGALAESNRAMLTSERGGTAGLLASRDDDLDLGAPAIAGNVLTVTIPFSADDRLYLYDGEPLARVRAFTALYVDGVWDHTKRVPTGWTGQPGGRIDFAPSSGDLGYFEIGSDLAPRFAASPLAAEPGSIVTVAGGTHGDGLPATQASIAMTWGVSVGPDGLVYLSDYFHHRIRRVDPDGLMETFAGSVVQGFGGDGGHRLHARLRGPIGIDWGADGTMYFVDALNHRVRAVEPSGRIVTIAGNGARGLAGDGGPAKKASLAWPHDVAVAKNGDVYIADTENGRIRKVDASDGTISTYQGVSGATSVNVPAYGLAVDGDGDLWASTYFDVREIDAESRAVATRVTGLNSGHGIAFDDAGRLFIADTGNRVVKMLDTGGAVTVVAGNGGTEGLGDGGPATSATLHDPYDVDVDAAGNLYIAEKDRRNITTDPEGHNRVRVVRPDGTIHTYAGTGNHRVSAPGQTRAQSVHFQLVTGLAYDRDGSLYIAESFPRGAVDDAGVLWRLDPNGTIRKVAGNGVGDDIQGGDIEGPALDVPLGMIKAIDVGPDGRVWIADASAYKIKVYDPTTGTIAWAAGDNNNSISAGVQPDVSEPRATEIYSLWGIAVADNGDVYWTETNDHDAKPSRIRKLSAADGKVYLVGGSPHADSRIGPITGFAGDGKKLDTATRFSGPFNIAFDNDGDLLIADKYNGRIREWDTSTGIVDTIVGDGARDHRNGTIAELSSIGQPWDVAQTADGGYLIAEDGWENYGIRERSTGPYISYVAPNGMVSTVAGTGVFDLSVDGAARATSLLGPHAIDIAPDGNVAVADYHRVRILTPPEGGWPAPAREVRCLPNLTDMAGDARNRELLSVGLHNPAVDLRGIEVDTTGTDLVVKTKVEDLDAVAAATTAYPLEPTHQWMYVFWDGESERARYVAAIYPANAADPTALGFSFEHGYIEGVNLAGSGISFIRSGPATGTADTATDTFTIRVPLATVGLEAGDRVLVQQGISGPTSQATSISNGTAYRFSVFSDVTLSIMATRSFAVGSSCPGSFS